MYDEALATLDFVHEQPFTIIDNQDEFVSTLIKCNKLHLHQAFDTPFAQHDMQQYIGEYGMAE
eukprot:10070839-Ditylum_brightwellii.AAC.1